MNLNLNRAGSAHQPKRDEEEEGEGSRSEDWAKVFSEVSFPRFWGVLWGGLFSGIFRFGDRKCRFRDIAICTYER